MPRSQLLLRQDGAPSACTPRTGRHRVFKDSTSVPFGDATARREYEGDSVRIELRGGQRRLRRSTPSSGSGHLSPSRSRRLWTRRRRAPMLGLVGIKPRRLCTRLLRTEHASKPSSRPQRTLQRRGLLLYDLGALVATLAIIHQARTKHRLPVGGAGRGRDGDLLAVQQRAPDGVDSGRQQPHSFSHASHLTPSPLLFSCFPSRTL